MALPQRSTQTVNVQVTGGLARVTALQEAVKVCMARGGRSDEEVIATSRLFYDYISGKMDETEDE